MAKSYSFIEYVANRFYNELYGAIEDYIGSHKDTLDLRLHRVRSIGSLELSDIHVQYVSVNDLPGTAIEFDVAVEADISVHESDYHYDETDTCQQWFMIHCAGDIENNLDDFIIQAPIEVYNGKNKPPKPMSDALVPIIYKEDLEKEAEDFLRRYYPKALLEPCFVNPRELADNMGLTVRVMRISKDTSVFGRCYFTECETMLYDPKSDSTYSDTIPAKTILVDKDVAFLRNVGAQNNTIIHECVHWDKHRKAFALARLYDKDLSSIGCKVAGGVSGNNRDAVDWMEWQANALAPRIQMPIEMFKKAASRLITETRLEAGNYDLIDIIEPVIDKLALEFGVSRAAAKIRMVDAGYEEAIGAFNYIDGRYVAAHKARKGFLKRNETFSISVQDAAIQRVVDPKLKEAIENGRYQYVDSHYVRSSPLYLEYDENGNTRLTHYARNHMDECCLVFQLSIIGQVGEKYHSECFLNRDERSLIDFDVTYHGGYENSTDKNQLKLLQETIAEENRIYGLLPNDYAAALRMVIDWRNDQIKAEKEAHPNKDISKITAKEIADRTDLNEATVRRTLKGETTSTNTLVLICLALHLPYKISRHIINRSPAPLSMSDPNHQLYDFVLGTHYGKTVKEVKSLLAIYGAEPL